MPELLYLVAPAIRTHNTCRLDNFDSMDFTSVTSLGDELIPSLQTVWLMPVAIFVTVIPL